MTQPFAFIVEDDEDISEIFREALSAAGYDAEIARDGQVALDRLKEVQPTVIILDLHVPHVSGEAILKAIKASPHLENSRVVLATADAVAAEFLRSQADFVMVKPISYVQLRDLTKRLNPALQTDRFKTVEPDENQ